MGRSNEERQARTRARQRRLELDRDRAARDGRLEDAAAAVYLAVTARDEAQEAIRSADQQIGDGLRRILAEGVTLDQAAELCDLDVPEVRRLTRAATGGPQPPPPQPEPAANQSSSRKPGPPASASGPPTLAADRRRPQPPARAGGPLHDTDPAAS